MNQTSTKDAGEVLQELVHGMVERLVDMPAEVRVLRRDEGKTVFLDVRVADRDVGYVIGKAGCTARCLRTIAQHAAVKLNLRCELNVEKYGQRREGKSR